MPSRVHPNALTIGEVALVRAMIQMGDRTDQEIQAGPGPALCRSFDHILCSKGDEP
jgi:hypothetical protein